MLTVLRRRNFALLWAAQLVSVAGDWVLMIGLPFYVYGLTHSTLATGAMYVVSMVPRVAMASLAGVFVDRWDRRWTMIVADLLRAALLLAMLAVRSAEQLWIVYAVSFLQAALSQFFSPAQNALLPRLVEETDLVAANSLSSLGLNIARVVAPSLGGAMLAASGLHSVVLFDSLSFALSAVLVALISVPATSAQAGAGSSAERPGVTWVMLWRQWVEGLRLVLDNALIRNLLLVWAIAMLGEGLLEVLFVPYVQDRLLGSASVMGWLMTAQGIGSVLGGIAIGALSRKIQPWRLVALGAIGWGLLDLVLFNVPRLPVVLPTAVLVGLPIVAFVIGHSALLQASTSDAYRGRVFGALGTVGSLTLLIGMTMASALGETLDIPLMLDAGCALVCLAGVVAAVRLGRGRSPRQLAGTADLPDMDPNQTPS